MARFRPTRAGIVNLWDYRDEEFLFVDGWLVLRGPNGSGKTKALEVLFPFVLDGRIEPRRLNPFAGEDRTMKSNLLYRGQESAHGYVWLEFGDGSSYVTIGIGLRAHRHNDRVTRWHFVAEGRVGVELSLLDADDRPLVRKDLAAALGPDAVRDSAEEYRQLVDARLFGLGPARYEQLLDLVLTLRKPQLAKDLNPAELSRTLQRGLRPLDDHLVVEAARSFDDMEAVARTLEGLVAADGASTAFLNVYATYLRTHARAAADALSARRTAVNGRSGELAAARERAAEAAGATERAEAQLRAAESEPGRLRAHLDRLKGSAAYRSHEQLADLERHVHDLAEAAERSGTAVAAERSVLERRRAESERAEQSARDARGQLARLAEEIAADARTGGVPWSGADAAADGLAARIVARSTARRDDLRAVRAGADRLTQAQRDHESAAGADRTARTQVEEATAAEEQAGTVVQVARERAAAAVRDWGRRYASLLAGLDRPGLVEELAAAVDAPSLREAYAEAVAAPLTARRDTAAALAARYDADAARRAELAAERDRVAAERDDDPAPAPTRPASRDGRAGGPLWRLVRFADAVPEREAAAIEAALHAAGLLDAWLYPGEAETAAAVAAGEQDGYLRTTDPVAGASLADVLVPEERSAVPADRVRAVLASIALDDLSAGSGVDRTGRWTLGVGTGRLGKDRCEYIGATARAVRRAERVAGFDRRLAEADAGLARIADERAAVLAVLAEAEQAAGALPALTEIQQARREHDRAAAALRVRQEAAIAAAGRLDAAVAERASADAALRRLVADRALPVDRLDPTAEAVDRFERVGVRIEAAHSAADTAAEVAAAAADRLAEAAQRLDTAEAAAREATRRHAEKAEELRTLRGAIGAETEQVLADVARTDAEITAAEAGLAAARDRYTDAAREGAAALARVELGERAVADALREARQDALRLRPYAQPDLLGLIRCPTRLRWPELESPGDELDPAVVALHEAVLGATRELSPTETSLKQSATRLTTALAELQAQLPATGLDHRPEWDTDDGVIVVRVVDEQGPTPVARFAQRIAAERRDQEQLLTDAEQRVFEDALLGQLAGQIHRRTIEARDLVAGMDAQMRRRRMSSGLTVGVGWRLSDDLDPDQRDVCKLLERDPARLGPAQLTGMRGHFASRIKAARSVAPEKPYRELLAEVLDYRQWRVFAFTLHRPGGTAEPLTRARHSQLSGGEQSVSLHLPLFAAANALFDSARPDAPRLLGLDEAFAGVDETGRGELMSLAKQFDLDLFMTGYDLWATHPAVTGAAHYDLSHSAPDHTVSAVLLVWDGAMNVADFDGTLARSLGSPETRRAPVPADRVPAGAGLDGAGLDGAGLDGADPSGAGLDG
ncbi:TIGR02680 family protein [Plantactinospora sp. KBS50]|uniref:TIGR02680 family protein n=1 Tax=Plantactinospora sp. KBS50 TaxID=2024580 RepID=UPI000BAAD14F|nr:TIGR02680 family protein [Plantactinospora sp. KBS50]ASW53203.1 TIGR02680 family protein [Plantactinospora sp. KBS50]